jgi:hypothetical protein
VFREYPYLYEGSVDYERRYLPSHASSPASFPERLASGEVRNRLSVHATGGAVTVDKLQMTRFERERWGIAPGSGQTVIDLGAAGPPGRRGHRGEAVKRARIGEPRSTWRQLGSPLTQDHLVAELSGSPWTYGSGTPHSCDQCPITSQYRLVMQPSVR